MPPGGFMEQANKQAEFLEMVAFVDRLASSLIAAQVPPGTGGLMAIEAERQVDMIRKSYELAFMAYLHRGACVRELASQCGVEVSIDLFPEKR